jgi:endonuclease YncB( thermonuclease family)
MKYLLATLCLIAAPAYGAELTDYTVLDGDTVRGSIDLGFGVVLKDQTIRIYGFDAWESTKHRQTLDLTPKEWEQEIIKGKVAKTSLESLLKLAKKVRVHEVSGESDPYGRRLAEIYADDRHVGDAMKAKGHARSGGMK